MARPLQQSPQFRAALSLAGVETFDAADGFAIRRTLPVVGSVAMLNRVAALRSGELRALRGMGLRIVNAETPETAPLRQAGFRRIMTPAHVAELDLTGDRQARMHQKWRNRLRKAEAGPLRLRSHHWSGGPHWLLEHELAQRKARRYRALPPALLSAYARATPRAALLVEAWCGAEPVAGMLFLRHGTTATYQLGWSAAEGRANGAHTLILDHAMTRLAKGGHTTLDLGVIDTETQPGLARFKLGAGGVARALGGTWLAVPGL